MPSRKARSGAGAPGVPGRRPTAARRLSRLLLTGTLALLLAAVAPGFAPEPDWIERRVGDLGVPLPAGSGWVQTQRDHDVWVATGVRRTVTGDVLFLDLVLIEAQAVSDAFATWPADVLAHQYLLWAIDDLTAEGVDTGRYVLTVGDITDEVRAGHRLYLMRNAKAFIEPWHPDLTREVQELYLLFLPDFATRPSLYKILLTADCFFASCTTADLDLSTLHPLLDRLRDYSGPPG